MVRVPSTMVPLGTPAPPFSLPDTVSGRTVSLDDFAEAPALLVVFLSNHAGGILGGISSGQDIVVRFAVKPTSSILTPRRTVTPGGLDAEITTKGRHDPCVGIRAVPIGEAMMACVLADHFLRHRGQTGRDGGVGY